MPRPYSLHGVDLPGRPENADDARAAKWMKSMHDAQDAANRHRIALVLFAAGRRDELGDAWADWALDMYGVTADEVREVRQLVSYLEAGGEVASLGLPWERLIAAVREHQRSARKRAGPPGEAGP